MKRQHWRSAVLIVFLVTGASRAQQGPAAAYESISDTSGPTYSSPGRVAYQTISDAADSSEDIQHVAYESMHAQSEPAALGSVEGIASLPSASAQQYVIPNLRTEPLGGGVVGATALFGGDPTCGVGPTCGVPNAPIFAEPSCGVAGCTSCGSGPSCGVAGPTCGLPGTSHPTCGLGKLFGGGSDCDDCSGPRCGALCTRNCPTCCGVGTHFTSVYGEFLYLRARNADVPYAVPSNGPITGTGIPIQIAPIGLLDPDYDVGFRAGMNVALDTVSSLDIRYTMYESETEGETSTQAPFVLHSLVNHPSSVSAATDGLSALANLDINFDLGDVAYRHLLICREVFALNYVLGARYARLEQEFDSAFVKNGTEEVATDIDFEGGGIRIGLETERYSCRNQLHVFAKGYASFVAGRFKSDYRQSLSFDPEVVQTSWEAGRIVPILDLELGVGWTSASGKLRVTGGYLVSSWFNTVTTQEFIQSVQGNDYHNLGETITFDGLTARAEYRF